MKPAFLFYFEDEPQFAVPDSRAHTAHLLRSYRSRAQVATGRYDVRRDGPHSYRVTLRYPGSPTAILRAA
jgi:hypothetical protein